MWLPYCVTNLNAKKLHVTELLEGLALCDILFACVQAASFKLIKGEGGRGGEGRKRDSKKKKKTALLPLLV